MKKKLSAVFLTLAALTLGSAEGHLKPQNLMARLNQAATTDPEIFNLVVHQDLADQMDNMNLGGN